MDAIVASVAPFSLLSVGLDIVAQSTYAGNNSSNITYPTGAKYGLVYSVQGITMQSVVLFKVGLSGDVRVGDPGAGDTTILLAPTTFAVTDRSIAIIWYG